MAEQFADSRAPGPQAAPVGASPRTKRGHCHTHGVFDAREIYRGIYSECPRCADEALAAEQAHRRQQAEALQQRYLAQCLRAAGLRGRFEAASFETYGAATAAQRKVLEACRSYAAQPCLPLSGLILTGPPGTGKTHLLCAIVRQRVTAQAARPPTNGGERAIAADICTAREIVRELRDTWRRDAEISETKVLEHYGERVQLLAIDEVGASFGTEAEQVQLLDVIDARYRNGLPTLIATNLALPALRAAVGERAFDRLREGATVLPCAWDSYRGRAA